MANRETTPEAEEDILGNVPGFEPDETGGADDNSGGNEAESGQEQTPPQGNQETQATDEAGTEQGNQQQQQSDPNQQQGVRYDAQGNVVDAKGNIIAPAGRWRRIDEQNNRLKEVVKTGTQKIAQLEGKLAEINFLNGAPAKYGLTNEEVAISLDMYNLFKIIPNKKVLLC